MPKKETQTGGRGETSGIIPGDFALSVGRPQSQAPKGWRWTKLTDLARLETGHTPSRKHPEYWDGNIPWVGIRDATGNHGRTIHKTNQYTNDLGISNSSARVLPKDTVCLSRTASVGYVIVMGKPMATSQDFVNWVCDSSKLDFQFLKYVLLGEKRSFLRFASGTTHQTIYFPEVKAFYVCHPELKEQLAISGILSSLDEKIDLNHQINTTLESMAQALFKSWFVDFDPVIDNALAAGNPIPEPLQARADARAALGDQRKSLPNQIRQQFPDRFVLTEEMGWVPEGWEVAPLSNTAQLKTQSIYPNREPEKVWTHFSIPAFDNGMNPSFDRGETIKSGKYEVPKTAILASKLNPQFPRIWMPDVADESSSVCSTEFMPFVPNDSAERPYVYSLFCSDIMQSEISNRVTGSTGSRQRVKPKEIAELPILTPSQNLRLAFSEIACSFFDKKLVVQCETLALQGLRDTLLPKLLSGELRIPEAERQVAETI